MSARIVEMARWIANGIGVSPAQLMADVERRWPDASDDELDAALDLAADLAIADGEEMSRLADRIAAGESDFTAEEMQLLRRAQGSGAAND